MKEGGREYNAEVTVYLPSAILETLQRVMWLIHPGSSLGLFLSGAALPLVEATFTRAQSERGHKSQLKVDGAMEVVVTVAVVAGDGGGDWWWLLLWLWVVVVVVLW